MNEVYMALGLPWEPYLDTFIDRLPFTAKDVDKQRSYWYLAKHYQMLSFIKLEDKLLLIIGCVVVNRYFIQHIGSEKNCQFATHPLRYAFSFPGHKKVCVYMYI